MKHRSVIAFVIVIAALFAAPQLSHDLQSFTNALGSRLSGELMHAFLSLPSAEPSAAPAVAPLRVETQLASCTKERPAAKQRKAEQPAPTARAEVRTAESARDQLAMIEEPLPVSEPWAAGLPGGALVGSAELPHKSADEVAMIIPPDSGIEPQALARAAAGSKLSTADARRVAEDVRVAYVATRLEGKTFEWRQSNESLRRLEESLPGAYEFRIDRDGSKRRVMRVKRVAGANCPAPATCAPRPPAAAPLPPAVAAGVVALVGE
jgi:hypothetical protein